MCGLRGFIRTPSLFVLQGVQVCDPADIDRNTPGGDTSFLNFYNSFVSETFFLCLQIVFYDYLLQSFCGICYLRKPFILVPLRTTFSEIVFLDPIR